MITKPPFIHKDDTITPKTLWFVFAKTLWYVYISIRCWCYIARGSCTSKHVCNFICFLITALKRTEEPELNQTALSFRPCSAAQRRFVSFCFVWIQTSTREIPTVQGIWWKSLQNQKNEPWLVDLTRVSFRFFVAYVQNVKNSVSPPPPPPSFLFSTTSSSVFE